VTDAASGATEPLAEGLFAPSEPRRADPPPGRAGEGSGEGTGHRRASSRWTLFAVVSLGLLIVSIEGTITATALATIRTSLHTSLSWAAWTVTAYQLGQTVALPIAGRISDLYGRKRVFLICVTTFTVSSLACGLAPTIGVLIPLRMVQALSGGAFLPSATGIIADRFGADRDRAIGLFTSIFPIGGMLGPLVGGLIITYWSWRGIFLVNVPIGALLVVLGLRVIPHSEPRETQRPDVLGAFLFGFTILAGMYGVTRIGVGSVNPTLEWMPWLAMGIFGAMFVLRTRRQAVPIIPPRLFKERSFLIMYVINIVFGGAVLGVSALVPYYAQDRYGMSALSSATLLTARAVGTIAVAAVAAMAIRRTGYRMPMIGGFFLMALGTFLLTVAPPIHSTYAWLSMAAAITGLGFGLSSPASNNATISLAPKDVAVITGLRSMFRQVGGIVGISVTTAAVVRSADQAATLADAFLGMALTLLLVIPLIFLVPEQRGGW
jgi:EmrB/QacA subfamily drug resistance transporter